MDTSLAHTPQRFGRYILLDRLGKGGMAEVFRALMTGAEGFRRDLVIKQIRPDQSHAQNFIDMFVHEARISALLHHPNIVQVFDFGQVDGCYFLAMELLRGRDLLAVMKALRERKQSFPIPTAVHIAEQVARGLSYAHTMTSPDGSPLNILHRDISPSNVMCLMTGGVKLLDFGIASAIGEMESGESEESTFKGKLSYMAPERLGGVGLPGGERREITIDGRIDIFSLGTVLWEVLVGKRLFQARTDAEKLRAILERPIPAPSFLRPEIPHRLDEIVLKALQRDPDLRYQTAQSLAEDLEQVALETKYQARMLPMLLHDLFGVGASGTHVAISALSAEFLAPPPPTTTTQPPVTTAPEAPPDIPTGLSHMAESSTVDVRHRSWREGLRRHPKRVAGMAAAAVAIVAGLGIAASGGRPGREAISVAESTPRAAAAVPSPRPALPNPVAAAADAETNLKAVVPKSIEPPANSVGANPSSSTPPVRSAPAPHAPRAPVRSNTSQAANRTKQPAGRVAQGLSIDPFAEAASRRTGARP